MQQDIDYGKALSLGYSTFFEIIGKIVPIALVAGVVSLAIQLIGGFIYYEISANIIGALIQAVAGIATTIVSMIVAGAIGGGIVKMIRGEQADAVLPGIEALTQPKANLLGVALKLGVVFGSLQAAGQVVTQLTNVTLGGLVSLASFIAIIYFGVRWYFAPIAAIAEGVDRDAAITRSETMAEGRFWNIVLLLIVVGVCAGIPVAIVAFVLGAVVGSVLGVLSSSIWVGTVAALAGIWAVIAAVGSPLIGAMLASAYCDLNPVDGQPSDQQAPTTQPPTYSPMDAE